jgi:hypothetical protein
MRAEKGLLPGGPDRYLLWWKICHVIAINCLVGRFMMSLYVACSEWLFVVGGGWFLGFSLGIRGRLASFRTTRMGAEGSS